MYIGVDMVKAARWERICEKFPSRLEKMFTEEERVHCESKGKNKAYSYAALWAAREAAGKGLGIGDTRFRFWRCVPVMDKVGGACSPLAGEF